MKQKNASKKRYSCKKRTARNKCFLQFFLKRNRNDIYSSCQTVLKLRMSDVKPEINESANTKDVINSATMFQLFFIKTFL